jgi:hypothetical protein
MIGPMPRRRFRALVALVAVPVAASVAPLVPAAARAEATAPTLTVPPAGDRSQPRRARHDRRAIIDCNWHGAWKPPEGWTVAKAGTEILAWRADHAAVLVHAAAPQRDLAPARRIAERVAGTAITFGPPAVVKRSRWHATTTLRGQGTLAGAPVEVVVVQHWRGLRKDLAWVQVAVGEQRAAGMRAMDAARGSMLMLVSHACECGYDCDRRGSRKDR